VILLIGISEPRVFRESLTSIEEVFLGNGDMLSKAWWLSRDDCFCALAPLPVHQIWFLKLVLEEPVHVWTFSIYSGLAPDNKAFNVSPIVMASLSYLLEEFLRALNVLLNQVIGFTKPPLLGERLDLVTRVGHELWKVNVYSMKVESSIGRPISKNVLLEVVITQFSDCSSISVSQLYC
jgi:hypothetical protein